MAFIYQRPKTKGYTAVWNGPDGKQVRRVTGETGKRAAQAKANEWEIEDNRAGEDLAKHRAAFTIIEQAARDLKSGRLTLARSEELLRQLHAAANPDYNEERVIPWFESWIEDQRPRVGDSTMRGYGDALAIMKETLGPVASNKPLRELTAREIEKALVKAKEAGRAGATVNKVLVAFRRACADAEDKGIITKSPARTVRPLPTTDSTLKAPFTHGEVQSLLSAATSDEWRGLITLGAHTGLRLSDLLELSAKDIHGTELHVAPKKTKRHRTVVKIPLSPPCLAWVKGRKGAFFPKVHKQAISNTSMQFVAIMKKAKVPKEITIAGDMTASRSFHSLRHTFNQWLTEAGVGQDERMKLTGHKSDKMNDLYTHVTDEALVAAVGMLPTL
jgi:integrase